MKNFILIPVYNIQSDDFDIMRVNINHIVHYTPVIYKKWKTSIRMIDHSHIGTAAEAVFIDKLIEEKQSEI